VTPEDAVDSNFRRALLERLGLTFEVALKDGQPVVVVRVSGSASHAG